MFRDSTDFVLKMHSHAESRTSFQSPWDGLLQLRDVVKEDELRHPTTLDANGEECLIVIKNGSTTVVCYHRWRDRHRVLRPRIR